MHLLEICTIYLRSCRLPATCSLPKLHFHHSFSFLCPFAHEHRAFSLSLSISLESPFACSTWLGYFSINSGSPKSSQLGRSQVSAALINELKQRQYTNAEFASGRPARRDDDQCANRTALVAAVQSLTQSFVRSLAHPSAVRSAWVSEIKRRRRNERRSA